jgi:undecaprenyl-diphosphatase
MQVRALLQNRALIAWSLTVAAVLGVFGYLAKEVLVTKGETMKFDQAVRTAIHPGASPLLTTVMQTISELGEWYFVIPLWLIAVGLLVAKRHRHAAVVVSIMAIGEEALARVLKIWVNRPRPQPPLFPLPDPCSFPSGHSMAAFCIYGVLAAILAPRLHLPTAKIVAWTLAALLTTLVGLSRVYLGYHYPTDVLGGYAAAMIWIVAVRLGYNIWTAARNTKLNACPTASSRPNRPT